MRTQMNEKNKLLRFVGVLAACLLVGFGVGLLGGRAMKGENWDPALWLERIALPAALVLLAVFALGTGMVLVLCAKRLMQVTQQLHDLDADDDQAYENIEAQLSLPEAAPNFLMVSGFALFPMILELLMRAQMEKSDFLLLFFLDLLIFVLSMAGCFVMQKRAIDLEKRLNPEKRGSLLDFSFNRQWMASCDEGELRIIHRAGYAAFRAGSMACIGLWMLSVLSMLLLDTGFLPVVMVCAVWLVMQAAYMRSAAKLS